MAERQDTVNFNAHLSSIVKDDLVNRSKIAAGNSGTFFKIVFPDIPELNGVELVVPLSTKNWPHYVHADIFRCITAKYPEITSPTFQDQSYRLQIYIEGNYLNTNRPHRLHDPTKYLPTGATVGLRYWPLRELSYLTKAQTERGVVSGIEEYTDADYDKAATLQRAAEDAGGLPHAPTQASVEGDAIEKAENTDAAAAADVAAAAAANGPPLQRAATAAAAAYAHVVLACGDAHAAMTAAGNAADDAEFYSAKAADAVDDAAAAAAAAAAVTAAAAAVRAHATTAAAAAAARAHATTAADAAAPAAEAAAVANAAYDAAEGDDAAYEAWKTNPAVVAKNAADRAAEGAAAADDYVAEAAVSLAEAERARDAAAEAASPDNRWGGKKPQSKRGKKKQKSKSKSKSKKSKTKKSKSKSKRNKRRSYKRLQ
jgi:hypothetical protein